MCFLFYTSFITLCFIVFLQKKALRTSVFKNIENPIVWQQKMLTWTQQYREVVVLDSNVAANKNQPFKSYDFMVAVDAFTSIKTDTHQAFEDFHQYQSHTNDWLFGYLTYDLKNDTEKLTSNNFDGLNFPDLYFFQPKKLFLLKGNQLEIKYLNFCDDEVESDFLEIEETVCFTEPSEQITIQARTNKELYLERVTAMQKHILLGNIYEANYCMEYFAEQANINPLTVYSNLNTISQAPFSVFLKLDKQFLLSASPERYLKKIEQKVISQPIKGTAKRNENPEEDAALIVRLKNDPKEQAENVMIVDLVRNDLSKTAIKNSVKVTEQCAIYSFKQVHQMISTIESEVDLDVSVAKLLKSTFPMGSMTGAPKVSAMQIIEKLENTKRGLYSGSVGYCTPNGDFDFNVIIRSILYNAQNKYLSFSVGSAITAASDVEKEYEECKLKANAMFSVLKNT